VETWGYDANGNRTHKNGVQIAVFDAQDRLLVHGDSIYEHNLMGQRTKKISPEGATTYRYDNLGNLRDVSLPNGTQVAYAIDPQDRRIGRKENGSWTHKWIYQDGLNPVAELDSQDRIRKAFVYADKGHVPAYMLTFDENGNENGQYRIVSDLLGSVRVVYDLTTGNPVQQIDYDVWGNIINDSNPDFQPFAFAGGLYDQQTKLTRFGARDYDPETGRWTAKDPIGFDGGDPNLYGYVLNDPINFIDPNGEVAIAVPIGIAIGVGGRVAAGWAARQAAARAAAAAAAAAASARSTCDKDDDDDDCKQVASKWDLKSAGIDAHEVKKGLGNVSLFEICKCKSGGFAVKRKGCQGPIIYRL
jgi:RHS repeat-associated protein